MELENLFVAFAQKASKMANTHESSLMLTFRIEWRCPFVARVRRSRDIGSRLESRLNFLTGQTDHVFSKNTVRLTVYL